MYQVIDSNTGNIFLYSLLCFFLIIGTSLANLGVFQWLETPVYWKIFVHLCIISANKMTKNSLDSNSFQNLSILHQHMILILFSHTSHRASAEYGVSSAGLSTTVDPAAIAAQAFRVIIAFGKFHYKKKTIYSGRCSGHYNQVKF